MLCCVNLLLLLLFSFVYTDTRNIKGTKTTQTPFASLTTDNNNNITDSFHELSLRITRPVPDSRRHIRRTVIDFYQGSVCIDRSSDLVVSTKLNVPVFRDQSMVKLIRPSDETPCLVRTVNYHWGFELWCLFGLFFANTIVFNFDTYRLPAHAREGTYLRQEPQYHWRGLEEVKLKG